MSSQQDKTNKEKPPDENPTKTNDTFDVKSINLSEESDDGMSVTSTNSKRKQAKRDKTTPSDSSKKQKNC